MINQLRQVAIDLRNLREEVDNDEQGAGATAGYLDKAMNAVLAASEAYVLHRAQEAYALRRTQEEEKRSGTT